MLCPSIKLELPATIQPSEELLIKALVDDDVGIAQVQFLLDGAPIGNRVSAPYELTLPISEELEGRTLTLSAIATDSAGQKQQTVDSKVQIISKPKATVPEYKFELPVDGQRGVEKSPVTLQISSSLGFYLTLNHVLEFLAPNFSLMVPKWVRPVSIY